MRKFHQILLIPALWLIACNSVTEEIPNVPQSVIDQSLEYFDGVVMETSLENEEGQEAWEVKIENVSGALVKFYWTTLNPVLLKMEGTTGPYTYDIWPDDDLINFSAAKAVAIAAVKNDALERWELAEEDDFIGIWVYTFYIGSQQVYVDAVSGDVLEID